MNDIFDAPEDAAEFRIDAAPGFYFTDTEYPEDYPDPGAGPFDTWDDAYDKALEYEIPPSFIQIRKYE